MRQRGARWLAKEQQEIGATEPDAVPDMDASRANELPRWTFTDLMSDKSLIAWHEIVTDAHKPA